MVDSLQTMQDNDDSLSSSLSLPGSVSQMKRVADGFLQLCKSTGVVAFLIGHVTKAHEIAGPKMLEHLVDTVVFFEGERGDQHRLVKTHKNRFGPTSEVGIFAMSPKGLVPVRHPSSFFVHARGPGQPLPPGAALTCILEGSRPMIVEMQALAVRAGPNNSPIGRAVGVEPNRMTLVAAVLDAHLKTGLLSRHYHYVSVVGGLRVFEPGIDLAMAAALLSSVHGVPVPPKSLFIGEIGLTGEVRGVPNVDKRVSEALSMGMEIVVVPQDSADHVNHKHAHGGKARVVSCASVHDLAKVLGITVDSSRADDASSEGYKAYGRRRRRAHSPEDSDDVELHG
jgi:DNA repair protein RadA/Sms